MNKLTEQLFIMPSDVFTASDISVLVSGTDNRRHALIKRAIAKKEILSIRRGLYCLPPAFCKNSINPYALAEKVFGPSYVSMESALSYHGWIPEAVYSCTCASVSKSKEFATPLGLFAYKPVPQNIFFLGVERICDANKNIFFMASPAKALVDYVYIHKSNFQSIEEVSNSLRIEEDALKKIPQKDLATLSKNYRNKRIQKFLQNWMKHTAFRNHR